MTETLTRLRRWFRSITGHCSDCGEAMFYIGADGLMCLACWRARYDAAMTEISRHVVIQHRRKEEGA